MIPPIPVRDVGYAAEALLHRITDLDVAIRIAAAIVVTTGSWGTDGPERIVLDGRIRVLIAELSRVRNALESVRSTIYPAEADRVATIVGAATLFAPHVMSGVTGLIDVARRAQSGRLWSDLRPVMSSVLAVAHSSTTDVGHANSVVVTALPSYPISHPVSLLDRISRIPSGDTHVRIEHYVSASGGRFEVYLSGTNFFGGPDEPWNFRSNLELVAANDSASLSAVRMAMTSAGITRNTPVVFTGHSQGGLIALALANSGEYDVDAVFTIGCPVGAVPDSTAIPTVHLVHPEDPVPAAGGLIDPTSSTWVVNSAHGETLFAAHHKSAYLPGIQALDALHDPRIDSLLKRIEPTGVGERRDYVAVISPGNRPTGTDAR